MHKERAIRLRRIGLSAAVLLVLSAAPALSQSITPARPITPPPPLPATSPVFCPADPGKGPSCSQQPTLPPLSPLPAPSPKPITPPIPVSPKTALSAVPARGAAAIDGDKVLSYFQRGATRLDTRKAFGFVLMTKSAVTAEESTAQTRFCRLMLASLEFATPVAAAREDTLATYWPTLAERTPAEIEAAFEAHDCASLLAWYDHNLARRVAARAGVANLSGPLLITWPSEEAGHIEDRNPLVVDFARADHSRAKKALDYWFRELRNEPQAWTSRIREGTIRAGLADAINDTAGVVVAVLSGKWESVTAASETP